MHPTETKGKTPTVFGGTRNSPKVFMEKYFEHSVISYALW